MIRNLKTAPQYIGAFDKYGTNQQRYISTKSAYPNLLLKEKYTTPSTRAWLSLIENILLIPKNPPLHQYSWLAKTHSKK